MTGTEGQGDASGRGIDPGTRIGHVNLKVADLDRALAFYCGVLGFELTQRFRHEAAFIAAIKAAGGSVAPTPVVTPIVVPMHAPAQRT